MAGSSAQLRRLGAELRRLRAAAGRTQGDIGKALGRTHTTLVNWERGRTKISKSDLACLLAELGVPDDIRMELERLRDEAGQGGGQWVVYGLPDWLRPLMSFEEDAVAVDVFGPIVIPGLLQTEAYARAIHVACPQRVSSEETGRWVTARMLRQKRLVGPNALRLHAVIAEAALRQEIGGPAVMAEQLDRLAEASSLDTVRVQVLPYAAGAHTAQAGNFMVLRFADPETDPPLAYFDGPLHGQFITGVDEVTSMSTMFEDVRALALSDVESRTVIATIGDEFHKRANDDLCQLA